MSNVSVFESPLLTPEGIPTGSNVNFSHEMTVTILDRAPAEIRISAFLKPSSTTRTSAYTLPEPRSTYRLLSIPSSSDSTSGLRISPLVTTLLFSYLTSSSSRCVAEPSPGLVRILTIGLTVSRSEPSDISGDSLMISA